ncbi:LAFA_0D16512g1_1 [Lachancea sp. 'fantastica']|nr:LAFA_0D16512g1_1 [Lachancea sp. 'fantastica']
MSEQHHDSTFHRTVSEPLLLSDHEHEKLIETGSTISQLPPDIDMNKLERGDLIFDRPIADENSPLSFKPSASKYNSIPLNDEFLNLKGQPHAQRSLSAPVELHEQPVSAHTDDNSSGNQNPTASGNNSSSMSFLTAWLWRLYYGNKTVFYAVIGFIIVGTTIYTALTGQGSKYYVVILRATTCYVLGADRAQSVFGKSFCEFGEHRT